MMYIKPEKRPVPPPETDDDYPPVEIVWEPPPLTRMCSCYSSTKPVLPEHEEMACLQFQRLPLRTVRSRIVTIRNESVLSATWSTAVRNWPRRHNRTLNEDQWASDVCEPGIVMQCTPSSGVLSPRGRLDIHVQVYADCWGLYHNQLLIKIENVEPIVLDVWVEAVGAPLQFALSLGDIGDTSPVLCWMTASDPMRSLRAKNVSRADLTVYTYTTIEHEYPQDVLPFRLYLRFFDVLPRTCPCDAALESGKSACGESSTDNRLSSNAEDMATDMEIYLAQDYGLQDNSFYKVTPETTTIAPGAWMTWSLELLAPPYSEVAPPSFLLLHALPVGHRGDGWYRPNPPPQFVSLQQSSREGRLQLSSQEVRVNMCALDLPLSDTIRVRKRFRVQNVGNGPLDINVRTKDPWALIVGEERVGRAGGASPCSCAPHVSFSREQHVPLYMLPRSSMEVCVEARVLTSEAWPQSADSGGAPLGDYESRHLTTTCLYFFHDDNVLKSIPLILDIEYPKLLIEPSVIDFGFVTDGDTRKSYFTITHSSRTESVEVVTAWVGDAEFILWPKAFTLAPGSAERVYIQYKSRWSRAPVEGRLVVAAAGGAGAWCRAVSRARAQHARVLMRRHAAHDCTDDTHLAPPALRN